MIYLVSYPHSGNTWFRYCVEYLTKKPTHGHQAFSISERNNNFLNIDIGAEPILIKRHELGDELTINDTFIFLLRNPSECIKEDQDVNGEFLRYYSLLMEYEKFKGKKDIFYFNELFDINFIEFLPSMGIKIDEERFDDLKENFENHKKTCLSIYNNKIKKPGANLENVPKIFLNHELIKKSKY